MSLQNIWISENNDISNIVIVKSIKVAPIQDKYISKTPRNSVNWPLSVPYYFSLCNHASISTSYLFKCHQPVLKVSLQSIQSFFAPVLHDPICMVIQMFPLTVSCSWDWNSFHVAKEKQNIVWQV